MTAGTMSLTRMQKNRVLALLSLGHGVAHWYNGMLSVLYPVLTVALGLSYTQVGLFDSSRGIVAVLVSLTGGYLADTFGRKRLFLFVSLGSLGICIYLLGFAQTFGFALFWLAVGGIGNSLWHPYTMPLLNNLFSQRRGMALATHDAGANTFHGLSPIVVGLLLGMWGWRFVTRIHLWPGLLMGLLLLLAIPAMEDARSRRVRSPNDASGSYRQALRSGILRNRQFMLVSGVSAGLTMARMGLFTFLPLFLAFELGLNSAAQGLYMGILTFSGALLAPAVGTLSDRYGLRPVLAVAMLVATLAVTAMSLAQAGPALVAMIALAGVSLFSTRSLIMVHAMGVTPDELGGSSVGIVFSLNRLFGILSPLAAGLISDAVGLRPAFYLFGASLFLAMVLTLGLRQERPVPKRGEGFAARGPAG